MKAIQKTPNIDIEPLYEITQGLEKGLLLFTAVESGVFDCLKKPKTVEEVFRDLKMNSKLTAKFLNSLVAIGLLTKKDSHYNNTLLSATYLVKDSPFYQGNLLNLMEKTKSERWSRLGQVLKEGPIKPPRKPDEVFDKKFILAMAEGAMRGGLHSTLDIVSSLPEFANAAKLLDLGGGHGLYAIAFSQVNPNLKSVIFDLPPVIEVAKEFIDKHEMNGEVHTIHGDFTKDHWDNGYDIIFASDALYKPKELLFPILKKIKETLNEGGLFISKHWTIDKERTTPVTTVLWDLMVSLIGHMPFYTYTNEEFVDILKDVGFKKIKSFDISTPSKPSRIIVAKKEDTR